MCVPNILMVSRTKSTHCIPHIATLTPFRTPMAAISHLLKFGLDPENERRYESYLPFLL